MKALRCLVALHLVSSDQRFHHTERPPLVDHPADAHGAAQLGPQLELLGHGPGGGVAVQLGLELVLLGYEGVEKVLLGFGWGARAEGGFCAVGGTGEGGPGEGLSAGGLLGGGGCGGGVGGDERGAAGRRGEVAGWFEESWRGGEGAGC